MRRWIQKLIVVLATGYILFFYSERVFWSFLRPGDKPIDFVLSWLVYSLLAWIFLLLVRQCHIAAFPAVFLAGAVYGWLDEGVVVDTLYGSADGPFPASISFTGLAWHALIKHQFPCTRPHQSSALRQRDFRHQIARSKARPICRQLRQLATFLIVDFYHAMEHLDQLLEALWGKEHPKFKKQNQHWTKWLLKNNVQKIIDQAREWSAGQSL